MKQIVLAIMLTVVAAPVLASGLAEPVEPEEAVRIVSYTKNGLRTIIRAPRRVESEEAVRIVSYTKNGLQTIESVLVAHSSPEA